MAEQWIVDDIKRRFPGFDWSSVPPLDSIPDVFSAYGLRDDSEGKLYACINGIMSDEYETEEEAEGAAKEMLDRPNVFAAEVMRHKPAKAEFMDLCRKVVEKNGRDE